MSGSGQKRIKVPVFELPLPLVSFFVTLPRLKAIVYVEPSRWTCASSFWESAFTTETPTPWSPPEIL